MKNNNKYSDLSEMERSVLSKDNNKSLVSVNEIVKNHFMKFFIKDKKQKENMIKESIKNVMINRSNYNLYKDNIDIFSYITSLINASMKNNNKFVVYN